MWRRSYVGDGGKISVVCLVAVGLWCAAVAFLVVGWALNDHRVMLIGLATSAAAATATIRGFFAKQNQILLNSVNLMAERDRVRAVR